MEKAMQQENTLQVETEAEPESQQIELELPKEEIKDEIVVKEDKEDLTEKSEAEEYGDSVKKRINKLTYKLREQERQSEEALTFAKNIQSENINLKEKLKSSDEAMFSEYGNRVKSDLEIAKQEYKDAYDSGNTDNIIAANEKISKLTVEAESLRRVSNQKKASEASAEKKPELKFESKETPVAEPHPKAQEWAKKNKWFGDDQAMTFAAFGIHKEMIEEGFDGASDDYYSELDNRLYKTFPNRFNSEESDRPVQTVASPTRKTKAQKARNRVVKLTQSQVAVAKKLGVPLEEYAKYVKE